MQVIDGSNLILGRMASTVAQELLKGESVRIVNAERVVVTGNKDAVVAKFKRRIGLHAKGNPLHGPKFPRTPHRLVKKSIEGMLPNNNKRGREALARLKVYIGVPDEIKEKPTTLEKSKNHLKQNFVYIEDVCKALGAKWY